MKSKTSIPGFAAEASNYYLKGCSIKNYISSTTNLFFDTNSHVILQMRKLGGATITCKSDDGRATCLCGEGQRCVSWSNGCRCEAASASDWSGGGPFGGVLV